MPLVDKNISNTIKHYLRFDDLSAQEYQYLFKRSAQLKSKFKAYQTWQPLHDRTLAMIFEKSSTRTRLSFEAGIHQLGGHGVYLNTQDTQLGRGEPIEDASQVISRMVDIIMIRTFGQDIIERFAKNSRVPVINGLTNEFHPCQVLADIFTYYECFGSIENKVVAWVGDANNMAYTWIQAAKLLNFKINFSSPPQYKLDDKLLPQGDLTNHLEIFENPLEACKNVDIITTDVWTSMGFESENNARQKAFAGFMVSDEMLDVAKKDVLFMHCLPAHRGEEVAASVIDGDRSIVWEEAENRLHVQKALMEYLLCGEIEETEKHTKIVYKKYV
jgi:ornithine carbamoyltransferase